MTNHQIITAYKMENKIPLETPLLTYGAWIKQGYKVKRGERSAHKVLLYKYRQAKVSDDGGNERPARMFMTECSLFLPSQVEKIK